ARLRARSHHHSTRAHRTRAGRARHDHALRADDRQAGDRSRSRTFRHGDARRCRRARAGLAQRDAASQDAARRCDTGRASRVDRQRHRSRRRSRGRIPSRGAARSLCRQGRAHWVHQRLFRRQSRGYHITCRGRCDLRPRHSLVEEGGQPSRYWRDRRGAARKVSYPTETFSTAAMNLSISSCVPTVTRTFVGPALHTRPMKILCAASACTYSLPGRWTSIMKKLVSLGMYWMPFFLRNAKVFSRILRLISRRSGTRFFTRRLAVAQARPVIGRKPPPYGRRFASRSGRPIANPARMPAMPYTFENVRSTITSLSAATRSLHGFAFSVK